MSKRRGGRRSLGRGGGWALTGALLLAGCSGGGGGHGLAVSREACDASGSFDGPNTGATHLQRDASWTYEPGATKVGGSVHVHWHGRSIVHQDGSAGVPNPPVNYAMVVNATGGFNVTARIDHVHKSAVIQLYGEIPVILDEHRYDPGSIRISLDAGRLHTDMWACAMQDPLGLQTNKQIPVKTAYILHVMDSKGRLSIFVDGHEVTTMADRGIFKGGRIWFGLDSNAPTGGFDLTRLAVHPVSANGAVSVAHPLDEVFRHPASNGLQQLVAKIRPDFRIGAAVSIGPLASDPRYHRIALGGNFGQFTTENAGKPQFVEPQPGVFDYGEENLVEKAAQRNGIEIHGHTAVFGEANPRWMTKLAAQHPKQMRHVMDALITHDVQRYQGVMTSYDVVDEPMSDNQSTLLRNDIWLRSIGPSYLPQAFRVAHRANPKLQLCFNDYGLEADDTRWVNTYKYIKHLVVDKHVPIGCVGFESHVYQHSDEEYARILRRHIEALARIGVASRVSEMDVETADGPAFQTEQFSSILGACLAEPTCLSFTTWGIGGVYGSTAYIDNQGLHYRGGLLWDRKLRPIPAVAALRHLLRTKFTHQ